MPDIQDPGGGLLLGTLAAIFPVVVLGLIAWAVSSFVQMKRQSATTRQELANLKDRLAKLEQARESSPTAPSIRDRP